MQMWILFALFIGALVVVAGVGVFLFLLVRTVRTAQGSQIQAKYPQGHWMGIGMAIGLPIGYLPALLIGIFSDNLATFVALGPALGCGLGVAIGAALEQKYKDRIRPLTEQEQQTRKWATLIGLLLVMLGVLALGGMLVFAVMR